MAGRTAARSCATGASGDHRPTRRHQNCLKTARVATSKPKVAASNWLEVGLEEEKQDQRRRMHLLWRRRNLDQGSCTTKESLSQATFGTDHCSFVRRMQW